jgi:hypothetical protein
MVALPVFVTKVKLPVLEPVLTPAPLARVTLRPCTKLTFTKLPGVARLPTPVPEAGPLLEIAVLKVAVENIGEPTKVLVFTLFHVELSKLCA